MTGKTFLSSLISVTVIASLLIALPRPARAEWLDLAALKTAPFAAVVSSFFSKVKSLFTGSETKKQPEATPSVVQANCVPPVPPKPAGFTEHNGRYGPMTATPLISTAGPNNTITIIVTPDIASRSVSIRANHVSRPGEVIRSPDYTKYYTGLGFELIDWGPKDLAEAKSEPITIEGSVPRNGVVWRMKNAMLPAKIPYWIKVKANHPTIAQRARYPDQFLNGWGTAGYSIEHENQGTSVGTQLIYVGGPQAPSLEINYPGKKEARRKPIVLRPNETFEISTKSLGQPGTITVWPGSSTGLGISPANAVKVLEPSSVTVSPNETKTWKLQPLGTKGVGPVKDVDFTAKLSNSCGEDTMGGGVGVTYDLKGLRKDQVNLTLKPVYLLRVPDNAGNFVIANLNLTTAGDTVVAIPNVTFKIRAVYGDHHEELAKNVLISSNFGGKLERAGENYSKTEDHEAAGGVAFMKIRAPNLKIKEAKRKIILQATTDNISGLLVETELPIEIAYPEKLTITPVNKIDNIKEGDKVSFFVTLAFSNNTFQTAPDGVIWKTEGLIGNINQKGVFEAKLSNTSAQSAQGEITAAYKDKEGNNITAEPLTLKVSSVKTQPVQQTPQKEAPKPTLTKAESLTVSTDRALINLKEGDKVIFKATLVMSDGSARAVKEGVAWRVVGDVGNITTGGVFEAKLGESVAEYGEGLGVITAIYQDASGTSFLGKTPTFEVQSFVPEDTGGEG